LFNDANDLRSYANSFDAIAKTLILQ